MRSLRQLNVESGCNCLSWANSLGPAWPTEWYSTLLLKTTIARRAQMNIRGSNVQASFFMRRRHSNQGGWPIVTTTIAVVNEE